jgi:hypothetical protein
LRTSSRIRFCSACAGRRPARRRAGARTDPRSGRCPAVSPGSCRRCSRRSRAQRGRRPCAHRVAAGGGSAAKSRSERRAHRPDARGATSSTEDSPSSSMGRRSIARHRSLAFLNEGGKAPRPNARSVVAWFSLYKERGQVLGVPMRTGNAESPGRGAARAGLERGLGRHHQGRGPEVSPGVLLPVESRPIAGGRGRGLRGPRPPPSGSPSRSPTRPRGTGTS